MATAEIQKKTIDRAAGGGTKKASRKKGGGTALSLYSAIASLRPKSSFAGDTLREKAASFKEERQSIGAGAGGYLAYLKEKESAEKSDLLESAAQLDRKESSADHADALASYEGYLKAALESAYGKKEGTASSGATTAQKAAILKTALEYAYTEEDGIKIALASGLSYEEALLIGEAVKRNGEATFGWQLQQN